MLPTVRPKFKTGFCGTGEDLEESSAFRSEDETDSVTGADAARDDHAEQENCKTIPS